MIANNELGRIFEGSGNGVVSGTILAFRWRDRVKLRKALVRVVNPQAEV
jgi:hypothetical protein